MIEDLNRRFRWVPDQLDSYRVMRNPTGPLRGDCDDYAATALWLHAGRSMVRFWWLVFTFRAVFWLCRADLNGERHVVLWVKGLGWIDNIYPKWSGATKHTRKYPVPPPLVLAKVFLGQFSSSRY